jgi:hypothetical protein
MVIIINYLTFIKEVSIIHSINKGPSLLAARFRSRGRSICQKWQPQVWDYENFLERRMSLWLLELSSGLMTTKATAS